MPLPLVSDTKLNLLTLASLRQHLSAVTNSVWVIRDPAEKLRGTKTIISPPIKCEGRPEGVRVCVSLGALCARKVTAWVEANGAQVGPSVGLQYTAEGEKVSLIGGIIMVRLSSMLQRALELFYRPAVRWFDYWIIPSSLDMRSVLVINAVTGAEYVGIKGSCLAPGRQVVVWNAVPGVFELDSDDVSIGEVELTWHLSSQYPVKTKGVIAERATAQERAFVFLAMIQHLRARVQADHDTLSSAYKYLIEMGFISNTDDWSDHL